MNFFPDFSIYYHQCSAFLAFSYSQCYAAYFSTCCYCQSCSSLFHLTFPSLAHTGTKFRTASRKSTSFSTQRNFAVRFSTLSAAAQSHTSLHSQTTVCGRSAWSTLLACSSFVSAHTKLFALSLLLLYSIIVSCLFILCLCFSKNFWTSFSNFSLLIFSGKRHNVLCLFILKNFSITKFISSLFHI